MLYPVGGLLADVCCGRYKIISSFFGLLRYLYAVLKYAMQWKLIPVNRTLLLCYYRLRYKESKFHCKKYPTTMKVFNIVWIGSAPFSLNMFEEHPFSIIYFISEIGTVRLVQARCKAVFPSLSWALVVLLSQRMSTTFSMSFDTHCICANKLWSGSMTLELGLLLANYCCRLNVWSIHTAHFGTGMQFGAVFPLHS